MAEEILEPGCTDKSAAGFEWTDPRTDPKPPAVYFPKRVSENPDDVSELVELCKEGRIYAVERWIRSGKPLQGVDPGSDHWGYPKTPLKVAIERERFDLAFLLLCNGYQPDLEPQSPLDFVLERRAWDYLELLIAWGADPKRANPYTVLNTYQRDLMERFWEAGVDFTADNTLADYLAESTRNKPAYGWALHHKEDPRVAYQLALALGEAVGANREKAVSLLLWAGADPHREVSSLNWGSNVEDDPDEDRESAIVSAVQMGHGKLLRHLKPDPAKDNFKDLYSWVCDPDSLDQLFDQCPPDDWSKAIVRNISRMGWWYGKRESQACLERIFDHHWGRLNELEHLECQELRRDLLRIEYCSNLAWVFERLAKIRHCDEAVFAELVRTPTIRKKMEELGLSRLLPKKRSKQRSKRPPGPKGTGRERVPARKVEEEWLNSLDPEIKAEILRDRISRKQLYKEVWAEPTLKVAQRYGVSDVAVAKWCKRMNIPRPGRGYWARKVAGQRVKQLPLPKSSAGHKEWVHRPAEGKRKVAPPTKVPELDLFNRPIPVPENLDPEHPLVSRTRQDLEATPADESGIIHPRARDVLDVSMGRAMVDRALRIMNALIDALEGAGFAVEVNDEDGNTGASDSGTAAVIHDERVYFSLTEATTREERPPTDEERAEMRRNPWRTVAPFYSFSPNGELTLQIEGEWYNERHRRKWTDGKPRTLEDCLYSFVRSVLISADALKHRRGEVGNPGESG